jgi:hypothetical protein
LPYRLARDKILAANYNLIGGITMKAGPFEETDLEQLAMYFAKELVRQRVSLSFSAEEIVSRFFEMHDELLTEFSKQNAIRQKGIGVGNPPPK